MRIKSARRKAQRGATLVEAVGAICVLFLLFFALLQIYHWCVTRNFCRYAAFYGSKGMSLGYKPNIALRAARVAALSISGSNTGANARSDEATAENYLIYGDASGVAFEYWHPSGNGKPWLQVHGNRTPGNESECTVHLRNQPLLHDSLGIVLGITDNPDPEVTVKNYNHSQVFLEQ